MNVRRLKMWRDQHRPMMNSAIVAVKSRQPYSPFSDELTSYERAQIEQGEIRFKRLLDSKFQIDRHSLADIGEKRVGKETSPYGFPLGISYRAEHFDSLVKKANRSMSKWEHLSVELRSALLCEAITRIHADTFLFSHVGMHTSGHGFFMGFHANAIHAQARALESVARICQITAELTQQLDSELTVGDAQPQRILRNFQPKPAGLSLVYSGRVAPTWGAYPSVFASLAAGCPVIVIPHPEAILPLALTVKAIKSVCAEAGVSADIINLFCSDNDADYRKAAQHRSVKLIDYMGKSEFGKWLRQHAWHARVMTQQSAQTSVFVHSTDNYDGMIENLAFGLCSYSAQLCTSPQNIYVLKDGIQLPDKIITLDTFQRDLVAKIDQLLQRFQPPRDLLGVIIGKQTVADIRQCEGARFANVLRHCELLQDPEFADAQVLTPSVIAVQPGFSSSLEYYANEVAGPVSFVIVKDDLKTVARELSYVGQEFGVLGLGLYTIDANVEKAMKCVAADIGALLSVNFCSNYFISQCSVFTDIHGGAVNSSSDVTYGAPAFYHSRLRMTEDRKVVCTP